MALLLNKVVQGNCLEVMRGFPEESVDMVMTSPPYWGLRNYGEATETVWGGDGDCEHEWGEEIIQKQRGAAKGKTAQVGNQIRELSGTQIQQGCFCVKCSAWRGPLGLEPTWQMYVEHMVSICRQIKRVLKKTGSMYLVLGDTYAGSHCRKGDKTLFQNRKRKKVAENLFSKPSPQADATDYKPKCLMGMPWRVAFALIEDGWILRERIVWHKDNPMPGSQRDRLTQTCEVIFHFVRNTGKALLWRNELTGEWLKKHPKQVYFHVETHELREDRPSKEEKYVVDEFGNRHLVWKPLWRGFDYYYELDAIREPHTSIPDLKRKEQTKKRGRPTKADLTPHGPYAKATHDRVKSLHPKGKNPGDVVSVRVKANLEHFVPKGSGGHFAYGGLDSKDGKHEHPKGKNPGDVVRVQPEGHGHDRLGSRGPGLRPWEERFHPKGKNPGDVIKHDVAVGRIDNVSYTDPLHVKPYHIKGKNPGDYWSIPTKPFKGAHFAVYPEAICVRPIKSSCPPDGVVLDPMCGVGTTCAAAKKLGRKFIGIDINPVYVDMSNKRLCAIPERLDKFIQVR